MVGTKDGNNVFIWDVKENKQIIHNIAKVNNVLQLIKLAIIYKLTPVIVGCKSFRLAIERAKQEGGVMNPHFFDRLEDAKDVLQICIVGVEIDPSAMTVQSFQPQNVIPLAFLPGNEGTGLTSSQRRLVDFFVVVPQYGSGTARSMFMWPLPSCCKRYGLRIMV